MIHPTSIRSVGYAGAKRALSIFGLTLIACCSFVVSVALHLDLASCRRAVSEGVTNLLSNAVRGRIEIRSIRSLTLGGFIVDAIAIRDETGAIVVEASDVTVSIRLYDLARHGTISWLFVRDLNLDLRDDGEGRPTLLASLAPKHASTSGGASLPPLAISTIDLDHLTVHGTLAARPIDATLSVHRAQISLDASGMRLSLPDLDAALPRSSDGARQRVEISLRTDGWSSVGRDHDIQVPALVVEARAGSSRARVQGRFVADAIELALDASLSAADVAIASRQEASTLAALGTVRLSLHAHGPLDRMVTDVNVASDVGALSASGAVNVVARVDEEIASLAVDCHDFAPRRLRREAPDARFDGLASLSVTRRTGGVSAATRGVLTGKDEPESAWFRSAKLSFSAAVATDGRSVHAVRSATAHIDFARATNGLSLDALYSDAPAIGPVLDTSVVVTLGALDALPPPFSVPALAGRLTFHSHGIVDLEHRTLHLEASVDAPVLTHAALRLSGAHVDLALGGSLAAPSLHARASVAEATLARAKSPAAPPALRAISIAVDAADDRLHASVDFETDRAQRLAAKFTVERRGHRQLTVRDASIELSRDRFRAHLTARRIDVGATVVALEGVRLASTAGGARLDARVSREGAPLAIDGATTDLDVDALARGVGLDGLPVHGTVRVTGKVARDRGAPLRPLHGTIDIAAKGALDLSRAQQAPIPFTVEAAVAVTPARASVLAHLTIADLTRLTLDAETDGQGWSALSTAPGKLDLVASEIDLSRAIAFARAVAPGSIPVADALASAGRLGFEVHVARASIGAPPTLHFAAKMAGTTLRIRSSSVAPSDAQVTVDLTLPTGTAGARLDVAAKISQPARSEAPLATAMASATLPAPLLSKLLSGHVTFADFESVALTAAVDLPEQPIARLPFIDLPLPPFAMESGALGRPPSTIAAQGSWQGSLLAPKLTLDVAMKGLHRVGDASYAATAHATYDGLEARADGAVSTENGVVAASAVATVRVAASDVVRTLSTSRSLPWIAGGTAHARKLPLALFPLLLDAGVDGALDADLDVSHFHDRAAVTPDVRATLRISSAVINGAHFDLASADATIDDTGASLDLRAQGAGGQVMVQGHAFLDWTRGLVPRLRSGAIVDVAAKIQALQLRALAPLATSLDELDGRFDLDAQVSATAPLTPEGHWTLAPRGTAAIHEGVVAVTAIGERWEGVEGNAVLTAEKLALTKLVLHGRGGRGTATLTGNIDLVETRPTTLTGKIETDRFALARDGVPIGEISGSIAITGRLDGATPKLVAVVDPMTVQLAAANGKTPQSLDEDPSIQVTPSIVAPVAPRAPPTLALEIQVEVPNNVWVRRDDVLVALRGRPTIVLGPSPSILGEVVLERGRVDVLGKHFDLARSTATFGGTADMDPTLDIEGTWSSPDDSVVTFKVTGRLSEPKLTFTASPVATDAQIMNLLVLGRRDAGSAADQQSATAAATAQTTAIAGAMSAAVLGGQLQRILPTAVSLSVRPGVTGLADSHVAAGYQWKRVYFEVGYNAGSQIVAPGAASQSTTTVGVEWRFIDRWSLMTTLGDSGSALVDLLWQFRY